MREIYGKITRRRHTREFKISIIRDLASLLSFQIPFPIHHETVLIIFELHDARRATAKKIIEFAKEYID